LPARGERKKIAKLSHPASEKSIFPHSQEGEQKFEGGKEKKKIKTTITTMLRGRSLLNLSTWEISQKKAAYHRRKGKGKPALYSALQ